MTSKRFILVVFTDAGHLNPMIAVAQHLERDGHEVVFFSLQEDVSARLKLAGLRATCATGGVVAISAPRPEAQRSVKFAKRLASPAWLKRWNRAVLVEQVPDQVKSLRKFLQAERFDILVADPMAYAAAASAELEGLPWVSVATGLQSVLANDDTPASRVFLELAPARDEMLGALGVTTLRFRGSDAVSPLLNTVFVAKDLVPEAAQTEALLVGAAIPLEARGDERPFPFERLPTDRPIVYIAFGSQFSHGPEVYEAFVRALSADEAFFVLAVKDLIEEPFVKNLPAHAFAVEYAPQLALLEHASVMVTHGGANSVHDCISRGKPMVVVPMVYDQPLFAQLVTQAGIGIGVEAAGLTTERCREVLLPLLRPDAPERARAVTMMKRSTNGAATVATLLGRL